MMLESAYEVGQDSKHKFTRQIKPGQLKDCIERFFPNSNFSFEANNNLTLLRNYLNDYFEKLSSKDYPSKEKPYPIEYSVDDKSGLFLYALCKLVKPEKIVETGTAYGRSSAYILQALHENQKGKLYSIDYVFRPWQTKQMIGSAIPPNLKNRWELVFGPSSEKLTGLLDSLGTIDIFFHDSLHTFKTMSFEFKKSWSHIKQDGFLLSDDATVNNAFYEFCVSRNVEPEFLLQEISEGSCLGIAQKR